MPPAVNRRLSFRALRAALPALTLALALAVPALAAAQETIPTPEEVIGFAPGTDYKLADYRQISAYFRALAESSDRVVLQQFGESTLGKPMLMAIISNPENLAKLDHYKDISRRLARARDLSEDQATALAAEGKVIVWIDSGLHATEVAHGQHSPVLAHWLATDESEEARAARRDAITLVIANMNPDGLDIVANWYRRNVGTPFETTRPPELYHPYVGHDNNRDWYQFTQVEHQAVAQQLYREWYPQLVYNHHQSSPFPGRIWMPPVEDPINPNIDPLVVSSMNLVGNAMMRRFSQEDKPGALSGVVFDGWWSGYMSDAPNYHNMVGFITETALYRYATPHCYEPDDVPDNFGSGSDNLPAKRPSIAYPDPWLGGCWHIADAMDYMMTANKAVLDLAVRRRGDWLMNVYRMGRRQIEKMQNAEAGGHAYVVNLGDQRDPGRAVEMLRALYRGGIEIHRADAPFEAKVVRTLGPERRGEGPDPTTASHRTSLPEPMPMAMVDNDSDGEGNGEGDSDGDGETMADAEAEATTPATEFPVGTYVMPPQPYRPFLVDLMETKDYPDLRQYPGGPPDPPYDMTGYEMPYVMGVTVDRIDEPFEIPEGAVGSVEEIGFPEAREYAAGAGGKLLSNVPNRSALAVNRLLSAGAAVSWAMEPFELAGTSWPAGTFVVGGDATTAGAPAPMHAPKIGLYKSWTAAMPEGWTRWLLEQYDFDFESITDADIREGDLSSYDVLVFPDQSARSILHGHLAGNMPEEYTGGVGLEGSLALKRYVENGGWLVALDQAVDFAIQQFGLPVRNVVANTRSQEFFIPGSLVNLSADPSEPLAFGMPEDPVAFFVNSQVLDIIPAAEEGDNKLERNLVSYVNYANENYLASGWILGGDRYLAGKSAAIRAPVGDGQVVLLAFEPHFRAQSHNTFKLLFNALYASTLDRNAWSTDEE